MKRIELIFYCALTLSFLIFLLPPQYKAAVYSPNALGWTWFLGLLPLTAVSFVVAGIINIKHRNWKGLKIRSAIFICVILLSIGYWYYMISQHGR